MIYDDPTLAGQRSVYEASVRAMFQDIKRDIPQQYAQLRGPAGQVSLTMPLRGPGFFGFHAIAQQRKVVAPLDAIKLFDDLAVALAYKEFNRCDTNGVVDYVGILAAQPNVAAVPPLQALGVPQGIDRKDSRVWSLSGKMLKTMIYFVLAHELGHVALGHQGNAAVSETQSQRNEWAADQFALATIKNAGGVGTPPAGMMLFFRIARRLNVLNKPQTHPMSSDRMMEIARQLGADPGSWGESPHLVANLASGMRQLAQQTNDAAFRRLHVFRSKKRPMSSLSACQEWRPTGP